MLILESGSQTHGFQLPGCTSQLRKDRCGGGETEQDLIPYNSCITVFQQIFCKRIFWMNFKLKEVHFCGSKSCANDSFFFKGNEHCFKLTFKPSVLLLVCHIASYVLVRHTSQKKSIFIGLQECGVLVSVIFCLYKNSNNKAQNPDQLLPLLWIWQLPWKQQFKR